MMINKFVMYPSNAHLTNQLLNFALAINVKENQCSHVILKDVNAYKTINNVVNTVLGKV